MNKSKFYPIWCLIFLIICSISFVQNSTAQKLLSPKRLTNLKDAYPVLSPDGARVLFQSNRTDNWQIYVMKLDGTELVQLTKHKANDATPVWSPDGSKIVFASDRDDSDSDIYVMDSDGTNQKRLTNQAGDDSHPHWSPDGTHIVFNSARSTPDLKADWAQQFIETFTMKADGSEIKQITSFKTVSTYPSYSPDGKQIVFRRVINEAGFQWDLSNSQRNSEIFVMNSDGTNPINLSKNAAYDGWGAWSPDGKWILFSSNRSGPANIGQLYIINPDGSNLQKITDGPGAFVQPSWSKDGKKILAFQHWETEEFGNLVMFDFKS